jgi:hypothetical protein
MGKMGKMLKGVKGGVIRGLCAGNYYEHMLKKILDRHRVKFIL